MLYKVHYIFTFLMDKFTCISRILDASNPPHGLGGEGALILNLENYMRARNKFVLFQKNKKILKFQQHVQTRGLKALSYKICWRKSILVVKTNIDGRNYKVIRTMTRVSSSRATIHLQNRNVEEVGGGGGGDMTPLLQQSR